MSFRSRFFLIAAIVLFCLFLSLLLGYSALRRSVPPESGTFMAPGLNETVEIGRDPWGVPHLRAENEHDLFFAMGYTCAQDRLWEMDLFRRAALGQLAEILGKDLLEADKFSRTVGFERLGQQMLPELPARSRAYLQAYCAGINAYIKTARQLPLEFSVLRYQPAPWKPEESLAAMRLVGWLLSMGWNVDLVYTEAALRLDSLRLSRIMPEAIPGPLLFPPLPGAVSGAEPAALAPASGQMRPAQVPAGSGRPAVGKKPAAQVPAGNGRPAVGKKPPVQAPAAFGAPDDGRAAARKERRAAAVLPDASLIAGEEALRRLLNCPAGGMGSNAWVVNGLRTTRGQAILANDTHLPFTVPSLYYLMHLKSPAINAVGAVFPGLPGVIVGRNEQISWGITNGMVDDIDFVMVEPDSAGSDYYRHNGQRFALKYYTETIRVRNSSEEKIRVAWTHLGPVVDSTTPLLGYRGSQALVLRWAGFENDNLLDGFLQLLTAADWRDFLAALENCRIPGENFFYADRRGQIGTKLAAAVPLRSSSGALVVPGLVQNGGAAVIQSDTLQADTLKGTSPGLDAEWRGMVPDAMLPQSFQPRSGWIANANNCMVDSSCQYYISAYWEPDYRYQRIKAAMDTTPRWDAQLCQSLQMDLFSGHAAFFVPYLNTAIAGLELPVDSPAATARQMLAVWDMQQSTASVASTLYESTLIELLRLTFADDLGDELQRRFLRMPHVNIRALDRLIAADDSLWFDDRTTSAVESRDHMLAAAYKAAVDSLTRHYGELPGLWSWGIVHQLTQRHAFGEYKPLRGIFNIGPAPSPGSNFTLNNSTYDLSAPYATLIGPCIRLVADMSTSEFRAILPSGQSGHPYSRHYQDLQPLWQDGRTITLSLGALNTRNAQWNWQVLRPAAATARR